MDDKRIDESLNALGQARRLLNDDNTLADRLVLYAIEILESVKEGE